MARRHPANFATAQAARRFNASLIAVIAAISLAGCSPEATFKAERLEADVVELARKDYKIDVLSSHKDNTLGVMWYADKLMDETGAALRKEVNENMGLLNQTVSRIALSTDAPIEFIVVAVRGREELVEFRMIQHVTDVKRIRTEALSVPEYYRRMLVQQGRYEPSGLGGNEFPMEAITFPEYIKDQVLQRTKMPRDDKDKMDAASEDRQGSVFYDGRVRETKKGRVFEFSLLSLKVQQAEENVIDLLRMIKDAFGGYNYTDYSSIIIHDLINGRKIVITQETMASLTKKKVTAVDILRDFSSTDDTKGAKVLRNTLEVFGFGVE